MSPTLQTPFFYQLTLEYGLVRRWHLLFSGTASKWVRFGSGLVQKCLLRRSVLYTVHGFLSCVIVLSGIALGLNLRILGRGLGYW